MASYGITTGGMPHVNVPGVPSRGNRSGNRAGNRGGNRGGNRSRPNVPGSSSPNRAGHVPSTRPAHGGHQHGGNRPAQTNPLLDPSETLKGKSLDRAAQGIADAQTVGPISELAKQIASNNQQSQGVQKQDFGYYMSLAKAAQDAVTQSQATNAGLGSQLAAVNSETQQALGQQGQAALGGVNSRLQALGLGGDTTANINAQTAQAQQQASQQGQTYQNTGALQGASNVQQAIADRGATGLAGQERIANVALAGQRSNEPLNAKIAGLQASRGSLKATALGQLRTAERNYQIAQEGLGVKQQGLQLTAAQDRAVNSLKAQGLNVSVSNQRSRNQTSAANNQRNNATSRANQRSRNQTSTANNQRNNQTRIQTSSGNVGGGSGSKPLTSSGNNRVLSDISRLKALIQQAKAAGHSGSQIRQSLESGTFARGIPSYDSHLIDAAWELLGYGHLTPGTAAWLHGRGVRGGGYKVAPPPKPKSSAGGVLGGILNNVP